MYSSAAKLYPYRYIFTRKIISLSVRDMDLYGRAIDSNVMHMPDLYVQYYVFTNTLDIIAFSNSVTLTIYMIVPKTLSPFL